MPDATTPYAGLTLPTVGADDNTWGGLLNGDLTLIDTFLRNIVPAGAMFPFAGSSSPTGFLLCNGSAVSRTTYAALFAAIGTAWGVGDGSTTFNVPNMVDRFPVGAGNLYTLASTGGAASQTAGLSLTIGSHAITQAELPNCSFTVTDPGHTHILTDPGHAHTVFDTGHQHALSALNAVGVVTGTGTNVTASSYPYVGAELSGASTYTDAIGAGVVVQSAVTGLSIAGHTTGITVASGGSGTAHTHTASGSTNSFATLPPYAAVTYIIKT